MTGPLRMSFEVACSPEHAFRVWTTGIGTWWPTDHTVSGDSDLDIVLEAGVGGRIYERTRDGTEHDWGEMTMWEPPVLLGYRWHLGQDPAMATDVEIHFVSEAAVTRIVIEHHGWERLARAGDGLRERNRVGWMSLLPHFTTAIAKEAT